MHHTPSSWRPTPNRKLKCNMDIAFANNRRVGAISVIIRDSQGNVITGKAHNIHTSSSLVAKVVVIREGLILARICFIEDVLLESDCLKIIEACRDRLLMLEVAVVVEDILRLKNSYTSCGLFWTKQEANRATHKGVTLSS